MTATQTISRTSRRRPVLRYALVAVPVVAVVAVISLAAIAHVPDGRIAPGVHVGEVNLGGVSRQQADTELRQWAAARASTQMDLRFPADSGIKRVWNPEASKLGLGIDLNGTLSSVGTAGRTGITGEMVHLVSGRSPIHVAPRIAIDEAKLHTYLVNQIGHDISIAPKRARLVPLAGGGFGTRHEVPGRALDLQASRAAIVAAWSAFVGATPDSNTSPGDAQAPIPISQEQDGSAPKRALQSVPAVLTATTVQPDLTSADLEQVRDELCSFGTNYTGTSNRRENVALAASKINGTLLRPGEVFSYNKVVGPRDEDAGFKDAPQYVSGKHVMAPGGGICQVSSTLFNAALLCGLKIVHRQNHSMPVGYLRHGRDATAVYGAIDMKFANDTSAPLYIAATASRGRLTFTLWGKKDPNREVEVAEGKETSRPIALTTISDPNLPAGRRVVQDKGSPYIHVTWVRTIKENGKVVRREPFSSSYHPYPKIIVVGTGGRKIAPRAPRPDAAAAPDQPAPVVTPAPQ